LSSLGIWHRQDGRVFSSTHRPHLFLLEAEWTSGLLKADESIRSLENSQGSYRESNSGPLVLWRSASKTAAPLAPECKLWCATTAGTRPEYRKCNITKDKAFRSRDNARQLPFIFVVKCVLADVSVYHRDVSCVFILKYYLIALVTSCKTTLCDSPEERTVYYNVLCVRVCVIITGSVEYMLAEL
jgi:hypothetical protein